MTEQDRSKTSTRVLIGIIILLLLAVIVLGLKACNSTPAAGRLTLSIDPSGHVAAVARGGDSLTWTVDDPDIPADARYRIRFPDKYNPCDQPMPPDGYPLSRANPFTCTARAGTVFTYYQTVVPESDAGANTAPTPGVAASGNAGSAAKSAAGAANGKLGVRGCPGCEAPGTGAGGSGSGTGGSGAGGSGTGGSGSGAGNGNSNQGVHSCPGCGAIEVGTNATNGPGPAVVLGPGNTGPGQTLINLICQNGQTAIQPPLPGPIYPTDQGVEWSAPGTPGNKWNVTFTAASPCDQTSALDQGAPFCFFQGAMGPVAQATTYPYTAQVGPDASGNACRAAQLNLTITAPNMPGSAAPQLHRLR